MLLNNTIVKSSPYTRIAFLYVTNVWLEFVHLGNIFYSFITLYIVYPASLAIRINLLNLSSLTLS